MNMFLFPSLGLWVATVALAVTRCAWRLLIPEISPENLKTREPEPRDWVNIDSSTRRVGPEMWRFTQSHNGRENSMTAMESRGG